MVATTLDGSCCGKQCVLFSDGFGRFSAGAAENLGKSGGGKRDGGIIKKPACIVTMEAGNPIIVMKIEKLKSLAVVEIEGRVLDG